MNTHAERANLLWSIAELLRDHFPKSRTFGDWMRTEAVAGRPDLVPWFAG